MLLPSLKTKWSKMIKKIIHLSIVPLSDTLRSTLLITEFQKRGIEVKYFDISNIIGVNYSGRNKADYKFERISSLLNYLNDLNRSEVLVNIQLHYYYLHSIMKYQVCVCVCLCVFVCVCVCACVWVCSMTMGTRWILGYFRMWCDKLFLNI